MQLNETRSIEQIERADGSKVSRIPVGRRHYRRCLAIGIVMFPLFAAAPFLADTPLDLFVITWSVAAFLFFCIWFWAATSYLMNEGRFALEIDETGIKERLLWKEVVWKWSDIESIQLVDVDASEAVGLNLKQKTWKRRWRVMTVDTILVNQYAVPNAEIVAHLHQWQRSVTLT